MKHLTRLFANRPTARVVGLFLSLSLLCSLNFSITLGVAAQGSGGKKGAQGTLPPGTKLGANLPDLTQIRNSNAAQPHIPAPVSNSRQCFDCGEAVMPNAALSAARLDSRNRTGQPDVDLLSQNFRWSKSLVDLKGRAGNDLKLDLVYNSLVWVKAGSQVAFDADRGQPSPGFRLGFPTIQSRYRDAQSGKYAYTLITPEGGRVELLQTENENVYEATDNSLMQMTDYGAGGAMLRRPDGAQLTFKWIGGQLQCTEIKDRNGNYISASYEGRGHLSVVVDTLGRVLSFNRDGGGNLLSVTESGNGPQGRVLATFGYSDLKVQTNFSGLKVVGPANGSTITVLTQVGLPDGSRYQFDYTSWGQVRQITRYAPDGHALAYTTYNLPQDAGSPADDCPRPTEVRNWVEGANNEGEAVTSYAFAQDGSWGQATLPDGSVHKEFFATDGWRRGLTTQTENWAGGALRRRTTVEWTQDDTGLSYRLNARQQEVNVYYSHGSRQRTRMEYGAYGLLTDLYRYVSEKAAPVEHTHLEYDFDPAYTGRHIIGLLKEQADYGSDGALTSRATYEYDLEKAADQGAAVQHDDANYGPGLQKGRGLVSAVSRWSAREPNGAAAEVTSKSYNTNGSVIVERNAEGRRTEISYADNFADGRNHRTFTFATTKADSKGYRKLTQYDYGSGAEVQTQDAHGTVKTFAYDAAGRRIATTNQATGATARAVYAESGTLEATFVRLRPNLKEIGAYVVFDGAGHLRARALQTSSYKGGSITRDAMGRIVSATKLTKMTSTWETAEPLATLNKAELPKRQDASESLTADVHWLGQKLAAGVDDLISAVQPTAQAQNVAPLEGDGDYYPPDDGIGHYEDNGYGYTSYIGDYDGAYSSDLGATWNAANQYWDFGGDQTPVQVNDESDASADDTLLIAGGIVLVFGGPEDPVGDVAAAGYIGYEWLIVGSAITAAGTSPDIYQTQPDYPPIPWDDPSRPPWTGAVWKGSGPPGSDKGAWVNPGTGETLHPDLNHGPPEGPHWDYENPANNGPNDEGWRVYEDGRMEPK